MPCYDSRDDEELAAYRNGDIQRKLDKLTRIACAAMRIVEEEACLDWTTKEARVWYRAHCVQDRKRARR